MSLETTVFEIFDADESKELTYSRDEAEAAFEKHFQVVERQIWTVHLSQHDSVSTIVTRVWN